MIEVSFQQALEAFGWLVAPGGVLVTIILMMTKKATEEEPELTAKDIVVMLGKKSSEPMSEALAIELNVSLKAVCAMGRSLEASIHDLIEELRRGRRSREDRDPG